MLNNYLGNLIYLTILRQVLLLPPPHTHTLREGTYDMERLNNFHKVTMGRT